MELLAPLHYWVPVAMFTLGGKRQCMLRKQTTPIEGREVVNYRESGTMEYDNEEERFTVTEMDDTLWGETT